MRKKDKLYTANKWNQPLFAQGIDRESQNIFDGLSQSTLNTSNSDQLRWDKLASSAYGASYGDPGYTLEDYKNSKNIFGISKINNPFSKGNIGNSFGFTGNDKTATGKALMEVGLDTTDLIGRSERNKRGLWDIADPVHQLAGGRESTVGNALGDSGVSLFKEGAKSGNGYMMLAGAGVKILGGLTNAAFGTKWNKDIINRINNNTSAMRANAEGLAGAATSADFLNRASNLSTAGLTFKRGDIGKDGWFTNKVKKKYNSLNHQQEAAQAYASHALTTGANNVDSSLDDSVLTSFAAMGGPLDTMNNRNDMGAIDYGFMSDYLTMRNKATEAKNKVPMNVFGSLPVTPLSTFALGGDMQTNGADFNTGLVHIDAGNSHEENPYDGVQLGVDPEGKPNLVEEGETIFDDYVFSKRIKADAETKRKFHVGKKANISYADLSKRIERESLERPNDPISQAGLRKQLQDLAGEQERQKAEQQQKEVETAFAMLPPEQQRAIMEQVAMEEQQAIQQQENPQQMEQMQMEQPTEEQIMQQQQMEQPQIEQPQMNAYGGKVNRFDDGGDMKKAIYNLLNLHTDREFDEWAYNNKVDKITDWKNILKNKQFLKAITGSNPILSDVISRGYDFGNYKASTGKYDLEAFNKELDAYKKSKVKGNTPGHYAPDPDFDLGKYSNIKDYEGDSNYKDYTNYLVNVANRTKGIAFKYKDGNESYDNIEWKDPSKTFSKEDYDALRTLQHHIDGTSINPDGEVVPLWNKADNEGYSSLVNNAGDLITKYRTDGETGIFHMTPKAVNRNNQVVNLVVGEDGTVDTIIGDVPKDWISNGSYSWQDAKNNYMYNYYKRPAASVDAGGDNGDSQEKIVPKHKNEKLRYAGLFGPLVGLGMQAMGIGKPDYSRMDAAVEAASGNPALASYKPIGNYLTYNPMDIWYEQNRMDANSRATDRVILNNASPIGTKMAGLLANGYNSQIADGDLYRKALEYNDAKRQKVTEFNRGTDMYNADAFTKTSATNAEIANRQRQFRAQMQMDAARQRMAADAAWNQGIYGNVSGLFKGISDLGRENAQHNMIADMAADGIFGNMSDKQHIGNGYLIKRVPKKKACGGRINRKRKGLTF